MKTFLTVLLLGSALFACDDSIPLQRREAVDLGVVGQGPSYLFAIANSTTWTILDTTVYVYEVPAHYECSKPGYAVVWKDLNPGYSVTCKKVQ